MRADYETLGERLRIVAWMGAAFVGCGLLQIALDGFAPSLFGAFAVGLALGTACTAGLYLGWRSLWHTMAGWSGEDAARAAWDRKDRDDARTRETWPVWLGGPLGGSALILSLHHLFGVDGGWVALWGLVDGLFLSAAGWWRWLLRQAPRRRHARGR